MELSELVLSINMKGVKLNIAKINADKGLLKTARERATKELFDLGYLDHLGSFSNEEIIRILRREYQDEVKCLYSNVEGSAVLTRERLKLCNYTTKDKDLKKVIEILDIMLKREELYDGLTELLSQADKNGILYPSIVATNIGVSSKFTALNNLDILEYLDFGEELVYISDVKSTIYYEFLVSLGIDEDIIKLCKNNNKGVLLDYTSYAQELSILDLILQYEITPNTEFKSNFLKERHIYYTSKDRFSQKIKYMKNNYKNLGELVEIYTNSGLDVKLCSDKYILYSRTDAYQYDLDSVLKSNRYISTKIVPSWNNISNYCTNFDTRKVFNVFLLLGGYVGEYVYHTEGSTLEQSCIVKYKHYNVNTKEYKEDGVVSIKNTDNKSNFNNIKTLSLMNVDVVFKRFGASDEAELFKILDAEVDRRYTLYNFNGDFELLDVKLILRDIVYGILHALVGEEFRATYNNQGILRKIYTSDLIFKISDLARSILKKYGIM